MNIFSDSDNCSAKTVKLEKYYRFHSAIYDITRWSFLFGREKLVESIPGEPENILEIGCGTGKNLIHLCRKFPKAHITGVDISESMLSKARCHLGNETHRVELVRQPYNRSISTDRRFDLVLFSYSLSMINPGWEHALECAEKDLDERGCIAVVDFHDSAFPVFKRWMGVNHVRMEGDAVDKLESLFTPIRCKIDPAYAGLWTYYLFIGQKRTF